MRTYELVMVVQPGLDEEGLDAFISGFTGFVTEIGGQIVDVEHMGRRRLAYPINKATEGHYVLLHLNMENPLLIEMDRRIKLSTDVLRHLVIRMDELLEPAPPEPEAVEEAGSDALDTEVPGGEDAGTEEESVDAEDLAAELADELADGPESEA